MSAVAETQRQYFTPEEANRQIPMLEETFARLLQLNAQLKHAYRRLQELGFAPPDENFEIAPPGAPASVVGELATLRTLLDATREAVAGLADAGCVLKNIEHGLVDWYALKDGREVFLCWKLGEKSVEHWHETDVGFPGRKPISPLPGPN